MYSRFPRDHDRPIQLPEHYSGCAFSEPTEPDLPSPAPSASLPPKINDPFPSNDPPPHREVASLFSKPLALFSDGLRFEELLLIGLIILLSRSEQDSDVILWLALLLFCK